MRTSMNFSFWVTMKNEAEFDSFLRLRYAKNDWSNYLSDDGLTLSRKKILASCGFSRSTLYQNKTIVAKLAKCENALRRCGILQSALNSEVPTDIGEDALAATAEIIERLRGLECRSKLLEETIAAARAAGVGLEK